MTKSALPKVEKALDKEWKSINQLSRDANTCYQSARTHLYNLVIKGKAEMKEEGQAIKFRKMNG